MFDKDQKSIYLLAEKVMTGGPGRGGSDRHRLPPFASDIVGDKKLTFRKDPDGLGAKTIVMYRTFGTSPESAIDSGTMTQFEEFVEKIAADDVEKWNEITQFLHYVYLSPGKFDKESREAAKDILDLYLPGWRPDWEEDSEHLPTFDEIRDDIQNHPGRAALERAKEKQEPKNIKIMKKAAEEYLKKQHQKQAGQ